MADIKSLAVCARPFGREAITSRQAQDLTPVRLILMSPLAQRAGSAALRRSRANALQRLLREHFSMEFPDLPDLYATNLRNTPAPNCCDHKLHLCRGSMQ